MQLHSFDLNLLVALDALLTERSVTLAGSRLNLSQPAMSGALARLRSHFGDELLVPAGRRMVLTPLGEQLAQPLRELLAQIGSTLDAKPSFAPATSTRHVSIATSDLVATVLMDEVARVVQREAPGVTLELRSLGPRANEALDRGELDFMILPAEYLLEAHPSEFLFEDGYTCAVWTGNAKVGKTISIDDYLSLGHVIVNLESGSLGGEERAEASLRKANHARRVEVVASSFTLAPLFVIGTDRVATLNTRLACKLAQRLDIRLVPLPIDISPLVEMLQWHRARTADPLHQWFRALLARVLNEQHPPLR